MTSLSRAPRAGVRARADSLVPGGRGETRQFKIPGLSKIRIGGSLGKAAESVKTTLNNTKVLGIPLGVGLAAGSGGGFLPVAAAESSRTGGDLTQAGKNLGQDLTAGAKNLPLAMGAAKAMDTSGVTTAGAPGATTDQSTVDKIMGYIRQGTPEALAMAKQLLGGGGLGGLLDAGTLAAGGVAVAQERKRANDLQDQAVGYAKGGYDAKAPLRSKAIAQLQDDSTPDLGSLFSNPGNVYDRQRRGMAPLTTAPSAASQLTSGNALSDAISSRVPVTPPAAPVPQPQQAPTVPPVAPGPNPQLLSALASQPRPGVVAAQPMMPLPPRQP